MIKPDQRVVLISGANRGLGRAIASAAYQAGYTLSLGARNVSALEQCTSGWDAARVACHVYDAEDHDTHRAWVEATVERFGHIDALVNNAGMVVRVRVEDENDAALDRMWAVNVKAPLSMIRLTLPHLRRCASGRVMNVASIAGKGVYNNNVGYAMSKFALVALSHATRQLGWEDGVRCTALCPSFVKTDMTADVQTFPLDDMMDPADIAQLALTVMALPNNASVAELVVNCRNETML
ncbi:MAG: SDR family NAD(P)-dependent oxidoreductase [Gammaproteobacteria bacterium]